MSVDFEVIQHDISAVTMQGLCNRQRNQLIGCMHSHNELVVLNRLLMFSLNDVGEGELHDAAQGVQMWCVLQVLVGKLYETWNMLKERFLKAQPEDTSVKALSAKQRESLEWLKDYFGEDRPKANALLTIRNKTAFHYDKLNLEQAVRETGVDAHRVYLAEHPVNSLYYAGSALVFETVFAMIADQAGDTSKMTCLERMQEGVKIALRDVNHANMHMHEVLYGLIYEFLKPSLGAEQEQVRVRIEDAPKATQIALPMFLNMGR